MEDDYLYTANLPDGVPLVANFNHRYNRLSFYYPRLDNINSIRTPTTKFFPVEAEHATPEFDAHDIAHWMREQEFDHTFVRGDFSSAKVYPNKGSHIYEPVSDVIRDTVANLIRDLITQGRCLGGKIAVREWIDLQYCPHQNPNHYHPTEVRYIIRDGSIYVCLDDVSGWCQKHRECDETYTYVCEALDDISFPDDQARDVADEFDTLAWSVDFARDAKSGEWYCIDMGLDGVYWIPETEEWCSISGYPDEYIQHTPENAI